MSTRFFTNNGDNTLLAKFRGIFDHNPDIERFDALIGYLRASGYFAIRPHLENVPKIRILVGINVDAIVDEYQKRGHLFLADSGRTLQQFRENMAADIRDSRYTPAVEQGILRFAEDVAIKKVEIRAHPTRRLHAKIYLFIPKGFNEHKPGAVITGSSNLTAAGLGVEDRGSNYEFNVLLNAYDDVKFASDEFNLLWEEGVPVLPTEITAITANSHLREDLTPFELYLKLLIEYFGPAIDYDPNSETDMPEGFMRLAYQMDAVKQGFLMPLIRLNFDANVRLEEQQDDFDILISTEVLAEGVNLHRANVILNYDTPWNSTRLMQRIGRVNRIGTTAETVHVFNFFPTAKLDADIELKKKAVAKLQAFHTALGEDSQIYSTEEVVDNFGLFDSDMQEEKDEALALLMELRKFRQENPARFREIRNLPLRARCGRRDITRADTTVTFIRNRRRDAFYHQPADGEPIELSFVEAARIFQANAKEKPCPLHEHHHAQVGAALDKFRSALEAESAHGDVVDHQIGPNEQKALRFLSLFLSLPMTSGDERLCIKAAQDAIRRARFAKLHRELNKLERAQKSTPVQPAILLEKALQILNGFPLMTADEGRVEENRAGLSAADLQPAIILSESFTD